MFRSSIIFCGLLASAFLLMGCGEKEPPPAPVAAVRAELSNGELPFPEWRVLRLEWAPSAALGVEGRPSVFLHLLNGEGELERTFDHELPEDWTPGEEIQYDVEIYQSALGPPLAPGTYDLVLGLYAADRRRWPLRIEGARELPRWEYAVARISVPSMASLAPAFEFPAAWQPLEAGGDLQILGRRWLQGDGSIQVLNLEVPGTVRLRGTVPTGGEDGGGWQLHGDTESSSLEISSTCSGATRTLDVPGRFDVVLPVFPSDEDLTCEIRFLADFELVHATTFQTRTLALEVLAWAPAEL